MEAFENSQVMVLDDERQVCEFLTDIIQSWGLYVESFTQPETAIESMRRNKYDIILLDVFMGDVCGLDFIPQFGDDLKIIVITGFADKEIAVRALKLGAFDLLEKPFPIELLYHSLLRALRDLEHERVLRILANDIRKSNAELVAQKQRLEKLNLQLLHTNKALSVFSQNKELERVEIERRTALKLRDQIMPLIVSFRNDQAFKKYESQLHLLSMQIEDLVSGFSVDSTLAETLSISEIRVASLIKNGVKTEEIASQLHISENTVRTHRKNIRRKLKIKSQYSLKGFLNSRTL